jgi:hypothetical protein
MQSRQPRKPTPPFSNKRQKPCTANAGRKADTHRVFDEEITNVRSRREEDAAIIRRCQDEVYALRRRCEENGIAWR